MPILQRPGISSPPVVVAASVVLALLFAGCNSQPDASDESLEVPDWVSEAEGDDAEETASLALNLKPGDRFPLRKTVEKEVIQMLPEGGHQLHKLRVELTLGMTVEDVRDGKTKLSVRYNRVRYSRTSPDEILEYDSLQPHQSLPLSIQAYQAMVGDGFAFWIDQNHQIERVEGFPEFIQRCLAGIPVDRRDDVLRSIESSTGENGVADFVDNAIGLLPSHQPNLGESWHKERHIERPVPMRLENRYTLKELTEDKAVIRIDGTIFPSASRFLVGDTQPTGLHMVVRDGSTVGKCTVLRSNGLPQHSRVETEVLMTAFLSDGRSFDQRVRGVTTLEAFPVAASQPPLRLGRTPASTTAR